MLKDTSKTLVALAVLLEVVAGAVGLASVQMLASKTNTTVAAAVPLTVHTDIAVASTTARS